MTVNFSRDYLRSIGRNAPTLQAELTNLLRLTPPETSRKDKKSEIIGVALGYKLMEKIVQLTFLETAKNPQAIY